MLDLLLDEASRFRENWSNSEFLHRDSKTTSRSPKICGRRTVLVRIDSADVHWAGASDGKTEDGYRGRENSIS